GEIAAPGGEIQDIARLPAGDDFRGAFPPQKIRATAEEMVRKIVAARDPAKHRANRLGVPRDVTTSGRHSKGGSMFSSSRGTRRFFSMIRAQVFQRSKASSLPGGRIASAFSNQLIASRKPSCA